MPIGRPPGSGGESAADGRWRETFRARDGNHLEELDSCGLCWRERDGNSQISIVAAHAPPPAQGVLRLEWPLIPTTRPRCPPRILNAEAPTLLRFVEIEIHGGDAVGDGLSPSRPQPRDLIMHPPPPRPRLPN